MPEYMTQRDAVRNLQRYLRRLSFEEASILPVPVDGIFESRTREALSAFQRIVGLPVTGVADRATWDALFAEYSRLLREEDRARFPDFFPRSPADYETRIGERHAFITLLQFMLNELNQIYDTLPLLILSGIYDDPTSRAVREFQRIHALPETGRVNRNTWNRITEEYNQYVP